MRFAKGSAGHLLAEAFMLPEFYAGRRSYVPTKLRSGVRYSGPDDRRAMKPIRGNLLSTLQRTKMIDWEALGMRPDPRDGYMCLVDGSMEFALAFLSKLRQARNARKAARSSRSSLRIVTTPKLCGAPGCERLPELHGKPMCGPHWHRVPGDLRRSILAGTATSADLAKSKQCAVLRVFSGPVTWAVAT